MLLDPGLRIEQNQVFCSTMGDTSLELHPYSTHPKAWVEDAWWLRGG